MEKVKPLKARRSAIDRKRVRFRDVFNHNYIRLDAVLLYVRSRPFCHRHVLLPASFFSVSPIFSDRSVASHGLYADPEGPFKVARNHKRAEPAALSNPKVEDVHLKNDDF